MSSNQSRRGRRLVRAKTDIKRFLEILISFKLKSTKEVLMSFSKEGLKLYLTDKTYSVSTLIPKKFFITPYHCEDHNGFTTNIKTVIECLQGYEKEKDDKYVDIEYPRNDGRLCFKLQEKKVITECDVGVTEMEENSGDTDILGFNKNKVINEIELNGEILREMLSEIYWLGNQFYLEMSPEEPHFTISSIHDSCHLECILPRDSEAVKSFRCEKTMKNCYHKRYVENIIKALKYTSICKVKMNDRGLIQISCTFQESDVVVSFTINCANPDDDEEEGEEEDDEGEEEEDDDDGKNDEEMLDDEDTMKVVDDNDEDFS